MALSFIGKPISLISQSDVRYRGILAGIDPQASTIQLSNVYSMGTENRRQPHEYIPPNHDPYEYIIFRASEVKDLSVDEQPVAPQPKERSVHDDPAVIGVSQPYRNAAQAAQGSQGQPSQQSTQNLPPRLQQQQQPASDQRRGTSKNGIHTATQSLENVERAIGDLRLSTAQDGQQSSYRGAARRGRGSGRGGAHMGGTERIPLKVPTTEFDFQTNNARFDKAGLEALLGKSPSPGVGGSVSPGIGGSSDERNGSVDGTTSPDPSKRKDTSAYNPTQSFFDSLTPGPAPTQNSNNHRGRGGGRGGAGKSRREEERERNFATFGEAGGVGLLGPGGYVGGWGSGRGGDHRRGGHQSDGARGRGRGRRS